MALNPEQQAEALKFLGYDPETIETIDDFKKQYQTDYIRKDAVESDKDLVGRIYGKKVGSIETSLKKTFKEIGVDFEDSEVENLDSLIKIGAEKVQKQIETLKQEGGKNNSEKVLKLEEERDAFKKKADELKTLHEAAVKAAEETRSEYEQKTKTTKLESGLDNIFGSVKYSNEVDDLKKRGFKQYINENFKFDLGEEGKIEVFGKDGSRIKSEDKAYEYLTPEKVLENEARKHKLWAENPNEGKPAGKKVITGQPSGIIDNKDKVQATARRLEVSRR